MSKVDLTVPNSHNCWVSYPQWFQMEDVASGQLHLRLEWLSLLPTPEKLDQVQNAGFSRDLGRFHPKLSDRPVSVSVTGADEHQGRTRAGQRRPVIRAARRLSGLSQKLACKSAAASVMSQVTRLSPSEGKRW